MPTGIYEHKPLSEKHKRKIGKANKGHIVTEETRKKISKTKKGKCSGEKNPMYGRENKWGNHTEETKRKISFSNKRKKKPTFTEEHKKKLSLAKTGEKNHMYGKHCLKETRKKISLALKDHKAWNKGKSNYWCKGEKNYNWKGGITPINLVLRMSSIYKIWRELVFLRDNFTCQNPNCEFCHNKIGGELHPHHIKTFSEFPELRFNIDNGITLCAGFHRSIKNKEEKYENLFLNIGARK